MFHVHGTYKETHATFTVRNGKGPLADWNHATLEFAQESAKFACRMALIYGYTVTLDLGPESDDLMTFNPGDAHYAHTIDFRIGAFSWQSKAV